MTIIRIAHVKNSRSKERLFFDRVYGQYSDYYVESTIYSWCFFAQRLDINVVLGILLNGPTIYVNFFLSYLIYDILT